MAYLDTSTIRKIFAALPRLDIGHSSSVFAIIELFSGILNSDDEFSRRQAAIRSLLDSQISIDWDMPETKLFRAFDYFRDRDYAVEEERIPDLKIVLDDVRAASSLADIRKRFDERTLTYGYDYFRLYKDEIGLNFINATVKGHSEIRRGHELSVEKGQIPQDMSCRDVLGYLGQNTDLNDALTRYALVEEVSRLAEVSELDKEQLFDSYNGTLDVYIHALSRVSIERASLKSTPGRNDGGDLAHLLYLDHNSQFATEDRRLADMALNAGVRVISSGDLRNSR